MAKVAEPSTRGDSAEQDAAGTLRANRIAGSGEWAVEDVICTAGPEHPSFEERHSWFRVAIVVAGTFNCRSANRRELLTPGSLLLGNAGQTFECGHEHGSGDRCLSFGYEPSYFEQLAAEAGVRGAARLPVLRVPPVRDLAPLVARACAEWTLGSADGVWEDVSLALAVRALCLSGTADGAQRSPPNAERGVTRAARLIDGDPSATLSLDELAREAAMSRYHFVRTFARLTSVTPHQYVRRARLRRAAMRLAAEDAPIIDVALECGFPDVSNFNRAFRAEFGATPKALRATLRVKRS